MNAPTLAVEATGLVKSFNNGARAVDGLDLAVPAGGVYGFLGPNGAGKTTTIRMLATLLRPDAGSARVLGHDVVTDADEVRSRVSLTGQFASLDVDLTGAENLVLLGRLLGHTRRRARERAEELLDAFGLADAADREVRALSGGMRRRLDISAGLIVTPELMFLDEPTTGLDPRSRNDVWQIIRALVEQGTTVLLTTQHLDEADNLADRIAVVDRGRVIAEGTPHELKAASSTSTARVRLHGPEHLAEAQRVLSRALGVPVNMTAAGSELSARTADPQLLLRALTELAATTVAVAEFEFGQPSLDDVFLALTGRATSEDDPRPQAPSALDATASGGRGA